MTITDLLKNISVKEGNKELSVIIDSTQFVISDVKITDKIYLMVTPLDKLSSFKYVD